MLRRDRSSPPQRPFAPWLREVSLQPRARPADGGRAFPAAPPGPGAARAAGYEDGATRSRSRGGPRRAGVLSHLSAPPPGCAVAAGLRRWLPAEPGLAPGQALSPRRFRNACSRVARSPRIDGDCASRSLEDSAFRAIACNFARVQRPRRVRCRGGSLWPPWRWRRRLPLPGERGRTGPTAMTMSTHLETGHIL